MTSTAMPSISRPVQFTPPPIQVTDGCCLAQLKDKVCDFIQSQWAIVAAGGLAVSLLFNPLIGLAVTLVGATAAWYFSPELSQNLNMFTANVLGIFSDPFEFEGDYGAFINSVKGKVENAVIGQAAGKNPTQEAIASDLRRGPQLDELLPLGLWHEVTRTAETNELPLEDIRHIGDFLAKYGTTKFFHFLSNCPPSALLGLDKTLRDGAKNAGQSFSLPILNSPAQIPGRNLMENKIALARALFTQATLKETKVSSEKLQTEMGKNAHNYRVDNGHVAPADIQAAFGSQLGAMVFYYLYQINLLHCLGEQPGLIGEVNQAKLEFMQTLGDPKARAELFADKFQKAGADVVFTQECDSELPKAMEKRGFVSTEKFVNEQGQVVTRSEDGSVIFLNPKSFSKQFRSIPYASNDPKHKATIIVATQNSNQKPIVLASCHGSASDAKDALSQIDRVNNIYKDFKSKDANHRIAIGIDANPKNDDEMFALRTHIRNNMLKGTAVGTTSNKTRKVTVQKEKVNEPSTMEKDLVITDPSFKMEQQTVGFEKPPLDLSVMLPNEKIPSDHAPVGVRLVPIKV